MADDQSARLTLLDGTTVAGRITHWNDASLTVAGPDESREVLTDELLDVRFHRDEPAGAEPAMRIELVDGTRLAITDLAMKGGIATLTSPHADEPLQIPRASIARVDLQPPTDASTNLWRQLAERNLPADVLLVVSRDGGKLDFLQGVAGDIDDERIAFDWDGQRMAINRSKAAGLAFYHADRVPTADAACALTLVDGSVIPAQTIQRDDVGDVRVATPAGVRLTLATATIQRADYSRGKLAYLSDLEPARVLWTPRIALPAAAAAIAGYGEPRRDASFTGAPLSLAWPDESHPAEVEVREYERGLALRSRTVVEYRLPAGMSHFAAIAGIDPATTAEGHVVLEIRADDRMAWEGEIDGTRPPTEIKLDLGAARRLQFRVDYGRNLDYGDCLHLVEARVTQ